MRVYKKGSTSGNGGCVHVSIDDLDGGVVWVKDEHGNECQFDFHEWQVFLDGVDNGEFDLPGTNSVTRSELHGEIVRLAVEVEKLRSALRHPSSHKARVREAAEHVKAEHGAVLERLREAQ